MYLCTNTFVEVKEQFAGVNTLSSMASTSVCLCLFVFVDQGSTLDECFCSSNEQNICFFTFNTSFYVFLCLCEFMC